METKLSARGLKALEITMRDVLDGLEDAASYMNYNSFPDTVEILSIEPPGRPVKSKQATLRIIPHADEKRSTNVVDFLFQRELKMSA
ncbi:MAG: hypothetical protein OEW97_03440 [Gammaproteobacteria bacterium]|nr:hypothetical protein [Gammaproteobacteria bacterium]